MSRLRNLATPRSTSPRCDYIGSPICPGLNQRTGVSFTPATKMPRPCEGKRGKTLVKRMKRVAESEKKASLEYQTQDTEIHRHSGHSGFSGHGDIQKQRYGDTPDTHDTHDSARRGNVFTIQQAINVSLEDGFGSQSLFLFSRALKAFEKATGTSVSKELESVFATWWAKAKPYLGDCSFDISLEEFCKTYKKTRVPLGKNSVDEAIELADTKPLPAVAEGLDSTGYKRLTAVCFHLYRLSGNTSFFLSVRDALRISGVKSAWTASAMLHGLERRGILKLVEQGKKAGRRASRYTFNEKAKP